jgi:hypothetical protein
LPRTGVIFGREMRNTAQSGYAHGKPNSSAVASFAVRPVVVSLLNRILTVIVVGVGRILVNAQTG